MFKNNCLSKNGLSLYKQGPLVVWWPLGFAPGGQWRHLCNPLFFLSKGLPNRLKKRIRQWHVHLLL
jgi:hypothetical protein